MPSPATMIMSSTIQAYLVDPAPGAECHGEMKRALFNRTWEHFTSHQHAPVGESLDAPLVVRNRQCALFRRAAVLGLPRPRLLGLPRDGLRSALQDFLPPALLIPGGPGWVEYTLHTQPKTDEHPARRIVHVVAYHPRRSLQSIPHVDQSWPTYGLSFQVRQDSRAPQRVYLAPEGIRPALHSGDGYLKVELPPVGPHTVVVIE